ncbi:MAG: hypothetical protein IJP01_00590 [Oscillospiraceae bacterium]|nr:hypothetical protein [Oscillospiraceae bacterium]
MNLLQKDTADLTKALCGTPPAQLHSWLEATFAEGALSFSRYMDALIAQKGMKRQDIIIKANLPQKYGYKLLSGETHTTDRDKILRICFSMQLTLQQTQRALKLYGMSELYAKVRRDALLICALNARICDIDRVNELLAAEKLPPLYSEDAR